MAPGAKEGFLEKKKLPELLLAFPVSICEFQS